MTENPQKNVFIISDSDSDSDFEKPQPKRVKVTYRPDDDDDTDFEHSPPLPPLSPSSSPPLRPRKRVKKSHPKRTHPLLSLLPPTLSPLPQTVADDDEVKLLKVLSTVKSHKLDGLSEDELAKLKDEEKELVALRQELMKKVAPKYEGVCPPEILESPVATGNLSTQEMVVWLELCQNYSNEVRRKSVDLNMYIRESLLFGSTLQIDNKDLSKRISEKDFESLLNKYNYLCIEVHTSATYGSKFQTLPPGATGGHSIVLIIDKPKQHIKIFDSSRFYDGRNFDALLYTLLLPVRYVKLNPRTGEKTVMSDDESVAQVRLNRVLCKFIVKNLFGIDKPEAIFDIGGYLENPQGTFREIAREALQRGWKFYGYRYSPQYSLQRENADKLYDDGYCATFSAWFCWLCTLSPYNVFRIDGVTEPPLHNIKAFAAYVKWCIYIEHEIKVPEKLKYYTEPFIDT